MNERIKELYKKDHIHLPYSLGSCPAGRLARRIALLRTFIYVGNAWGPLLLNQTCKRKEEHVEAADEKNTKNRMLWKDTKFDQALRRAFSLNQSWISAKASSIANSQK